MSAETLITDNLDLWTGAITKRITSGRGSNKKIELTGIHKLRHLILELACHGQIVPQLASETPACEVLEGLQLRRKELIRKRKIKNSKPLPNVSADEKPSKLPSNWVWTRLGSIAEISPRNCAEDATEASFVPMPLITTSYHGDHGHETKPWGKIKKGYTHFADGDVALAKITPCFENSKAAVFRGLINGLGAGTTELHVARPLSNAVNPYYLILFLKSPRFLIEGQKVMTGSAGQKRVPKDYFSSTPLPLPPTKEQHRIVQKVDELMALCDRLEQQTSDQIAAHDTLVDTLLGTLRQSQNATELAENWTRLAANFDTLFTTEQSIGKLKQTILQLAVMGRLVEQDAGDEPVITCLGSYGIKTTEHVRPGWAQVRLGDLGEIIGGATPSKRNPNFWHGEIPWVSPKDMKTDQISDSQEHISVEAITNSPLRIIPSQSLLMVVRGMILAHSFPVAMTTAPVTINQDMKALVPPSDISQYLLLFLKARKATVTDLVDRSSHGTCKLKSDKLWALPVELPPIREQERILRRVDELMALCDQLKEQLNQASETRCQLADAVVEGALN